MFSSIRPSSPSGGSHGGGQVDALLGSLGKLIGPAIEKMTGQGAPAADQADAIVRALAASPQALQVIAEALAGKTGEIKAPTLPVLPPSALTVALSAGENKAVGGNKKA